MHSDSTQPLVSFPIKTIRGELPVPGDKSISHRALLLGSQRIGKLTVHGLLEGEDVLATAAALRSLGVTIVQDGDTWHIQGVGIGGLAEPSSPLDMGNSGTAARLMMGLVTPYPFTSFFSGDESLSKRPMQRVITPLEQMGARIVARSEGRFPLALQGTRDTLPISYRLPVASAQVKSCIMLAALNTAGVTEVIEPTPTRDHTERMFASLLGVQVETTQEEDGTHIKVTGQPKQSHADLVFTVPADPSSAAFPLVAALITPDSEVTLKNICLNPLRTGLFTCLQEMGADITIENIRNEGGEYVGDITARSSSLNAIDVPAERAASMIDEYPILAVAAAYAKGTTRMRDLHELRVKESDRLQAVYDGLIANGVTAEIDGDDLIVTGGDVAGGGTVTTHFDHRIAMSFLVMGMASAQPVTVDDGRAIATSFPQFLPLMADAGADICSDRREFDRCHKHRPTVIAIDGPAASGKGTLARKLADYYGYGYLDTGSLYRAVGMRVLNAGQDPADNQAAINAANALQEADTHNPHIRQEKVGKAASVVSAIPEVRAILLDYQRDYAKRDKGAVLDGRDIGTVVCPEADVKIFMSASVDARAGRRHRQLEGQGIKVELESVKQDLIDRDRRDAERSTAPMKPAEDAYQLDTSEMNANEVFAHVLDIIAQKQRRSA